MSARVMIEIGEQTLLDYIPSPIMMSCDSALRENGGLQPIREKPTSLKRKGKATLGSLPFLLLKKILAETTISFRRSGKAQVILQQGGIIDAIHHQTVGLIKGEVDCAADDNCIGIQHLVCCHAAPPEIVVEQ
jgi:hypothetical protein